MAQFIQLFDNETDIVDVKPILAKIPIPPPDFEDVAEFVTDFPGSKEIIYTYFMRYIDSLNDEVNYFRDFRTHASFDFRTKIIHLPKYTYSPFKCEEGAGFGSLVNFHIYLNDCDSAIIEIYSPFTDKFQRFKARAGLVLIYPAFWGVMVKITNTLEQSLTFIKGTIRVGSLGTSGGITTSPYMK